MSVVILPIAKNFRLLWHVFILRCYSSALTRCLSWAPTSVGRIQLHTRANASVIRGSRLASISMALKATNSGDVNEDFIACEFDDADAKSQFGTKEYWDNQYQGRGDFPMDEYQWYLDSKSMESFSDHTFRPRTRRF